jgi:hypothetical protein
MNGSDVLFPEKAGQTDDQAGIQTRLALQDSYPSPRSFDEAAECTYFIQATNHDVKALHRRGSGEIAYHPFDAPRLAG